MLTSVELLACEHARVALVLHPRLLRMIRLALVVRAKVAGDLAAGELDPPPAALAKDLLLIFLNKKTMWGIEGFFANTFNFEGNCIFMC